MRRLRAKAQYLIQSIGWFFVSFSNCLPPQLLFSGHRALKLFYGENREKIDDQNIKDNFGLATKLNQWKNSRLWFSMSCPRFYFLVRRVYFAFMYMYFERFTQQVLTIHGKQNKADNISNNNKIYKTSLDWLFSGIWHKAGSIHVFMTLSYHRY